MPFADDIRIAAVHPGYNRFKVACDIQDACNPSGVARELVRIIADAMRDPACTGTDFVRADPAVVAVVDKLSSLMRLDPFEAHRRCSQRTGAAPSVVSR
jgi:hypothetical protein